MKKIFLAFFPVPVAQAAFSAKSWDLRAFDFTGLSTKSPYQLFLVFLIWALSAVALVAFIFLIYSILSFLKTKKETDEFKEAKKRIVYSLMGVVISILCVLIVGAISDLTNGKSITQKMINRVSLSPLPLSQITKNSQSVGQLSGALPRTTTLSELEQALKDLPEGNSLSFTSSSSKGSYTLLTFKKENSQIKLLYIDNERMGDSNNEKPNKESLLDKVINVARAEDSLTDLNSLSKDQVVALLNNLLDLLKSPDNDIISIITNPPTEDLPSPITFSQKITKCITSGGSWFRFSSSCALNKNKCATSADTTDCSTAALSFADGCSCPEGSCSNTLGQCVAESDSTSDNPCFNQEACTTFGGYWDGTNQSNIECRCLSIPPTPAPTPTPIPTPQDNPYKKACEETGGSWKKPHQPFFSKFFSKGKSGCSCSCSGCNCWDEEGKMVTDQNEIDASSEETGAAANMSVNCGLSNSNSSDESLELDSLDSFVFDYDWPANWSYGFGNPWMKRPFCQCPQGKKLDENGHCVITTNNPKIKSCTDSGGNWTTIPSCCGKEYQKCGSESVVCNCTANPDYILGNMVYNLSMNLGCQCPEGQCIGKGGKCVSKNNSSAEKICKDSGGTWIESSDSPQYSFCKCSGDPEINLDPSQRTSFPASCSDSSTKKLCKESGGIWKKFANSSISDQEKCSNSNYGVTIWDPVDACDCPSGECLDTSGRCVNKETTPTVSCSGKVDIGRLIGQSRWNNCVEMDTLKNNCSSSSGEWKEYPYLYVFRDTDETSRPSNFCSGRFPAFYQQERCDGPNGPCTNTAYPYKGCKCSENQCLNSEGKCIASIQDPEKVCKSSGGLWMDLPATVIGDFNNCYCPNGKSLKQETGECVENSN